VAWRHLFHEKEKNMANVHEDVARLINTHGLEAVKAATNVAQAAAATPKSNIGQAASYIREIITGDQAFDENVLARVSKVLSSSGGQ
jgi:hypothetical protein